MTDKISSLTVVLESDIQEDDAQDIMAAIAILRGVLSVTPHVADVTTWAANERARRELIDKLWQVLK